MFNHISSIQEGKGVFCYHLLDIVSLLASESIYYGELYEVSMS